MSTDDKFGIGAGLLALGLAAGVILLGQLTYDEKIETAMNKAAAAAADSGKTAPADTDPALKPSLFYRLLPHRELVKPEAIFDGIVCALALPAGICFFAMGVMSSGKKEDEAEQ